MCIYYYAYTACWDLSLRALVLTLSFISSTRLPLFSFTGVFDQSNGKIPGQTGKYIYDFAIVHDEPFQSLHYVSSRRWGGEKQDSTLRISGDILYSDFCFFFNFYPNIPTVARAFGYAS